MCHVELRFLDRQKKKDKVWVVSGYEGMVCNIYLMTLFVYTVFGSIGF